ncbi:MAG: hypothetical protein ABIQ16_18565 [Polyangiaceae bacterium]
MAPRNVLGSLRGLGFRPRTRAVRALRALVIVVAGSVAISACGDPVRDRAREALGPEQPGVSPGPLHRPGQPCLVCHSDQGGEEPFLSAGTVFISRDSRMPIENVKVNFLDSAAHRYTAVTNCAGNFIVRPGDFAVDTPYWVSMQRDDVYREMDTAIYREGSCSACHSDPIGPASAGHVFLIDDETVPVSACH